jgi:histidinol-phosphate phosphatase family protein
VVGREIFERPQNIKKLSTRKGKKLNRAFVLFDRDGTLIEHVHHLIDPYLVQFKSDLQSSLQLLKQSGYRFGIISNQSVIGRGLASTSDIDRVNRKIIDYLNQFGISIDFVYFCPHHPDDLCECRKPALSLGLRAITEHYLDPSRSFMIGDQESDMLFGKNLGCTTIQVSGNANKSPLADYYSVNLDDAAKWIQRKKYQELK